MNKGELINYMSEKSGQSKADAERALNLVTDSIIDSLGKGNKVNNEFPMRKHSNSNI